MAIKKTLKNPMGKNKKVDMYILALPDFQLKVINLFRQYNVTRIMQQQNWLKVPDDAEWKLTYISYSQPTMQINI